ncbi:MAG: DUF4340 domain-containing protein [Clostridia bacterium]|nr:DUF4340 domain-containing protein [Clostridia bacterium]
MDKGKKLLILLAAAIVLIGGYFAAAHFLKDDTGEDTDADAETVPVQAMRSDAVVGVEYICGDETISLVKDGETWKLDADRSFPVKQDIAAKMVDDAAGLSALRLISENPDDFAEYGLSEPETAYVFRLADGSSVIYYLGNYNSFGGSYYMNVAGTDKIYLISGDLLDDFDYDLSDLADVEPMDSISTETVYGLTLTLDDKTTKLFQSKDGLASVYSDKFTWFFDKKTPADSVTARELVGDAVGFSSDGCAAYKADKKKLASYGLDHPVLKALFEYTVSEEKDTGELDEEDQPITETVTHEEKLTLSVGNTAKDGQLYAMTDQSDVVYLISPDYLQTLRDFDYSSLRVADVCAVQTTDVQSMDVTIDGKTSVIRISRSKDDESKESVKYTLDGKQITPVQFNDFFTVIQTMQAEGYAETVPDAKTAEVTVTYHTSRKGFETMTLKLIPYDQNFYAADLNGDAGRLVNKRSVEKLRQTFLHLGES